MSQLGPGAQGAGVPVTLHDALVRWQIGPFDVGLVVALVLLGTWYVGAVRRLGRRGRPWPRHRIASFVAGLVFIDLAFQSPVAALSMSSFSAHVIQHMMLMLLAPPLLALGAPSTLALQTAPPRLKSAILKALHSRPFAALSHPVAVWFLYYGVMFVFFLTPLLGVAMAHMALMDVFNLLFLAGGTLFWWPLVSPDPIPSWRFGYGTKFLILLVGVPFESFLGIALMSQNGPAAPIYSTSGTHAGGGLLWAIGELAIAVAMAPIYRQWMRSDERDQRRADRRPRQAAGISSGWAGAWQERTGYVPVLMEADSGGSDQAELSGDGQSTHLSGAGAGKVLDHK